MSESSQPPPYLQLTEILQASFMNMITIMSKIYWEKVIKCDG